MSIINRLKETIIYRVIGGIFTTLCAVVFLYGLITYRGTDYCYLPDAPSSWLDWDDLAESEEHMVEYLRDCGYTVIEPS